MESSHAPISEQDLTLTRQRKTLAEEVADKLREHILLQFLKPGMQIVERDLAAALGVSRTPLREALRILELEGLVEYSVTRRPRIAAPTIEEIVQNLEVLGVLEGLAGELACQNATAEQIEEIQRLNQAMQQGSDSLDPLKFFQIDMDFHTAIISASGNLPLIDTHRQYNARLWRARFISSQRKAGRETTLKQHDDIATSLLALDRGKTATAMRSHLASTVINVTNVLREQAEQTGKDTA